MQVRPSLLILDLNKTNDRILERKRMEKCPLDGKLLKRMMICGMEVMDSMKDM